MGPGGRVGPGGREVIKRQEKEPEGDGLPPGHTRIASFPDLITHAATTDATVTDQEMTGVILDDLAEKNLAPARQYAGPGYLSAGAVLRAARIHGTALTGPVGRGRGGSVFEEDAYGLAVVGAADGFG